MGLENQGIQFIPTCIIGLLVMSISKRYQRMGDLVAGTIVVNVERKRASELATFSDTRVASLASNIPAGFVVPSTLARCLGDYVDRRRYLPHARVGEIARHLGAPLVSKFGLPADTNHDLLMCALYYRTFIATGGDEAELITVVPTTTRDVADHENIFVAKVE